MTRAGHGQRRHAVAPPDLRHNRSEVASIRHELSELREQVERLTHRLLPRLEALERRVPELEARDAFDSFEAIWVRRLDGSEWEIQRLGQRWVWVAQPRRDEQYGSVRVRVLDIAIEDGGGTLSVKSAWEGLHARGIELSRNYVGNLLRRMVAVDQLTHGERRGWFVLPPASADKATLELLEPRFRKEVTAQLRRAPPPSGIA
jgi:hypothetical protein